MRRPTIIISTCVLCLTISLSGRAAQTGLGGVKAPVVTAAVTDRFVPPAFGDTRIRGVLGDRMRVNLEGRLLHVDERRILAGFQHRPGEQDWIGEHAGKFLDAAANEWSYTHDPRLKVLMDRVARALIATQDPDGYLGTYVESQKWTSWDVWVHKYDLIGLLAYHRVTGDAPSLEASRKVGDLLCRTFGDGPGQRDIVKAGEHVGMAATSVLEPMCALYRATGERRYLDFCLYITRAYDEPNGPRIVRTLAEIGRVDKTANGKAYEMLSNLVGLVELYRITGDSTFLTPAVNAWKDIVAKRLYVTGTASSREHFQDDFVLPGEKKAAIGEGCVTVTWLQLNWQLLRLTGDAQYADEIEKTVYNSLIGAQDSANGDICYYTPLVGAKPYSHDISCCVSSEPRGISMIPELAWGSRENGVAVLLYTPGETTVKAADVDVRITSRTRYPLDGTVALTIDPQRTATFPVFLRVPAWTTRFSARVGGERFEGRPGQFLTIARAWKPSDTIQVDIDMTTRVLPGGRTYPDRVAVQRGPQVLALDDSASGRDADTSLVALSSLDARTLLRTKPGVGAYTARAIVADRAGTRTPRRITLVPFADARTVRVWLARPDRLDDVIAAAARAHASQPIRASAARVRRAPVIDGRLDEPSWALANPIGRTAIGTPNNLVRFGTEWDDEFLYAAVDAVDESLNVDATQAWENDSIEIFIDGDHNRGEDFDASDRQIVLVVGSSDVRVNGGPPDGVRVGWLRRPGGYSMEVAIPWKVLRLTPRAGSVIGFDVGVNDNDGGGNRSSKLMWSTASDDAWHDTSEFGDLVLGE